MKMICFLHGCVGMLLFLWGLCLLLLPISSNPLFIAIGIVTTVAGLAGLAISIILGMRE